MPIRTVSLRKGGTKPEPDETIVFIARPSLLQNDKPLRYEAERDEAIDEHEIRLRELYKSNWAVRKEIDSLAARVRAGEKIALQCWCAPCRCHGDNIIKLINEINAAFYATRKRRVIQEEEM